MYEFSCIWLYFIRLKIQNKQVVEKRLKSYKFEQFIDSKKLFLMKRLFFFYQIKMIKSILMKWKCIFQIKSKYREMKIIWKRLNFEHSTFEIKNRINNIFKFVTIWRNWFVWIFTINVCRKRDYVLIWKRMIILFQYLLI